MSRFYTPPQRKLVAVPNIYSGTELGANTTKVAT